MDRGDWPDKQSLYNDTNSTWHQKWRMACAILRATFLSCQQSPCICHIGGAMNVGVGWNGRCGTPTYDGVLTHLGVDPGIPMPGLQMILVIAGGKTDKHLDIP